MLAEVQALQNLGYDDIGLPCANEESLVCRLEYRVFDWGLIDRIWSKLKRLLEDPRITAGCS